MNNPEVPTDTDEFGELLARSSIGADARPRIPLPRPDADARAVQELVFLLPPAEVEYQRIVFLSASLLRGHGDKVTDALNTLIAETS